MKKKLVKSTMLVLLCALFYSCAPTIHYIGDSYAANESVEIFYDEKDVKKEFRTIGKMTNDKIIDHSLDSIKEQMILKAKSVGADGIIFTDLGVDRPSEAESDRMAVKATLIKFL